MGPADFFRSRFDNIRAHPIQNLASTVFGGFVPGGGIAANALFNRYNDNRFNNSAQQFQDLTRDQSNMDTNAAMNKPPGDPRLSGDNGFNWEGPTGSNYGRGEEGSGVDSGTRASQNQQLGLALSGGGGMTNGGGPSYQPYGGPSMTGQQWQDRSGGYGNIIGQMLGVAPDRGPLVDSLLDPISMGAGLPGSGQLRGPQAHRDYREGLALNGPGVGNYGVSNFMVGGSPVIFGAGDPNGIFRHNQHQYGG